MKLTAPIALVAAFASTAIAQYPRVPKAVADEANGRRVAADKLSDEAFAKA